MQISEIESILTKKYRDCICSLSKASIDDSSGENIPLCSSQMDCYNYDKIVGKNFVGKDFICSVDAIIIGCEYINFIEFKNGCISSQVKKNIRNKIMEGMYYFERFILQGKMMSCSKIHTRFILVYNPEKCVTDKKKNRDYINNTILDKANQVNEKRFINDRYDKDWHIFDEAISLPVSVFQERLDEFVNKIKIDTI